MFTFNGTESTVYNDICYEGSTLVAEPGQSYDLESAPDENWTGKGSAKAPVTPPEAPTKADDTESISTPTTN